MSNNRKIILYFCRQIQGLSFIEPLLINYPGSIVLCYGEFSVSNGSEICKRLRNNEIYFVDLYQSNFIRLCSVLLSYRFSFLRQKFAAILVKNLRKLLTEVKENPLFFFDTSTSEEVKLFVSVIRNAYKNQKIYSWPHGINIFANRIIDRNLVEPVSAVDLGIFDISFVVVGDNEPPRVLGNICEIYNFRNSYYWLAETYIKDTTQPLNNYKKNNLRILVYLSKLTTNIHPNELKRFFQIISSLVSPTFLIRPHPQAIKEAKKFLSFLQNVTFDLSSDPLTHINSCDYVISLPTNVMVELHTLGVPYLFPSYLSSNIVKKEFLESAVNLTCADHVYEYFRTPQKTAGNFRIDNKTLIHSKQEYKKNMEQIKSFIDSIQSEPAKSIR